MVYSETTGLLEIDRNYKAGRRPDNDVGRIVLLQSLARYIRKAFASRLSTRTEGAPLAKLSDYMLEDIGISRAQAIELDRRRSEAR